MRKAFSIFLALILCISLAPLGVFAETAASAPSKKALRDYLSPTYCDVEYLLRAADSALEDGMDGTQVLQEMSELAEEYEITVPLNNAVENIAAQDSQTTQKLRDFFERGDGAYGLDVAGSVQSDEVTAGGVNLYDVVEVSDALKALLADKSAQYCLQPYIWPESAFQTLLGKTFSKFKPSHARPGYICVVVKNGSEAAPTKTWPETDDTSDFTDAIESTVNELLWYVKGEYENSLVVTGNPNLASLFLVFDLKYSFYANYGSDPSDYVKGYNCSFSLSVRDSSGKVLGTVSGKNALEDTIYSWSNWIAKADIPALQSLGGWTSLAKNVGTAALQQRSSAISSQKITAVNALSVINGIVVSRAEKTKEPWQKAIYLAGASDVRLEEDTVILHLRGFETELGEPWSYGEGENPAAWLRSKMNSAAKYALEVSLPVKDGQITQKGFTALQTAVTKAASAAKQVFAGKEMTAALKDYFFGDTTMPSGLQAIQKQQTLNVSGGPHELVFSCVSADPVTLLNTVVQQIADEQAFRPRSERSEGEALQELFNQTLMTQAAAMMKRANTKYTVTLDIDDLLNPGVEPDDLTAYLESYDVSGAYDRLQSILSDLLDRSAVEKPKNGLISGNNKGTSVTFRIPSDESATYIIMRSEATGALAVSCFVYPGKSAAVHVPEGRYVIAWCSGPYWYGEEDLFGTIGSYSKSETVQILGRRYRHTFTLVPSEEGDVSIYQGSPNDFQ